MTQNAITVSPEDLIAGYQRLIVELSSELVKARGAAEMLMRERSGQAAPPDLQQRVRERLQRRQGNGAAPPEATPPAPDSTEPPKEPAQE